jgi:hypothetical protein
MAGVPVAGYVADDRTILNAPEPTLKKMLAAKGDGPLAKQLRRVDLGAEVSAAFVMEPMRPLAAEFLKDAAKDLPPEFADVATLHQRIKAGTLALNLSKNPLLAVTLEAENEESARVLEKLAGQGHDLLKQSYPDLRKDLAKDLPPEVSKEALAVIDQVPQAITIARREARVTVTLQAPNGLAGLSAKLGQMALAGPGQPAGGGEWKTFTSREDGFSASFPGEPKKAVKASGPGGTATDYGVQIDGGTTVYSVNCFNSPVDQEAIAKGNLEAMAAGFGKSLKARQDIKIKGHPGLQLELEVDNQGVKLAGAVRIFVVKKRIYTVTAMTLASKKGSPDVQKFLDSFALLDDGAAPPPPPPDGPTVAGLPPKPLPKPAATGASLKGTEKAVMDVSATSIKLPSKTTLPNLAWADDKGSAFYALADSGLLRRVSFPDLKEEWKLDLQEPCSWLSVSGQGVLVTAGGKEVWLIDPGRGEMKGRFPVPGVKRAASVLGSDLAVAATGTALYVLDLKKMTALKFAGPGPKNPGYDDPVMTADRKYVITGASGQIHRYALADGKLRYEDSSAGVVNGRVDSWVTVSPDGKRVCYPSYVGGGTGKNYTLAVFAVDDLGTPQLVLDPGGTAIGFDPAGGYICTNALNLYDDKGKFLKSYNLSGASPRQILAHPAGGSVLVFTDDNITAVTLPKK